MKDNLIVVKCWGGLGNQMFIFAFAKALEQYTNHEVLLDISFYKNSSNVEFENTGKNKNGVSIREFLLDIFPNIKNNLKIASKEQTEKSIGLTKSILPGEIRRWFNIPKYYRKNLIKEKNAFEYNPQYFEVKDKNVYFEGYFQNEKYFKNIENDIINYFKFSDIEENDTYNFSMKEKILNSSNPVFVHVRRGDYVNLGCELSDTYYKNAVKHILDRVDNPTFFVFANEAEEYIRNSFNMGVSFEYVGNTNEKNNEDWKDLRLMTLCKHSIMANSSFSRWAAFLNGNKDKIITVPTPWSAGDYMDYGIKCKCN